MNIIGLSEGPLTPASTNRSNSINIEDFKALKEETTRLSKLVYSRFSDHSKNELEKSYDRLQDAFVKSESRYEAQSKELSDTKIEYQVTLDELKEVKAKLIEEQLRRTELQIKHEKLFNEKSVIHYIFLLNNRLTL